MLSADMRPTIVTTRTTDYNSHPGCKARERPPTGVPLDRLTGRRNEARYGWTSKCNNGCRAITEVLVLHQNINTEKYPGRESHTGLLYGVSDASRDTYNTGTRR